MQQNLLNSCHVVCFKSMSLVWNAIDLMKKKKNWRHQRRKNVCFFSVFSSRFYPYCQHSSFYFAVLYIHLWSGDDLDLFILGAACSLATTTSLVNEMLCLYGIICLSIQLKSVSNPIYWVIITFNVLNYND